MSEPMSRAATHTEMNLGSTVAGAMRTLAGLFQVTVPLSDERIAHRLLLGAVLGIGALLRFWGLGSFGLQGDEETMAMATMHIVRDGVPILPSGMLYPRGLTELYLMAGSVKIFGESEWAFRLPSVLCGIAASGLAYQAGRRFLRPHWNLAFAATVALLPALIEYSQTARMYIFMEVCIAACLACIFAWERTNRLAWLVGAVVALVFGIELHALAVTCVLLFLLPGILHGDPRKYAYGLGAVALCMLAYLGIDAWVNANYPVPPPEYAADLGPDPRGSAPTEYPLEFDIALWLVGAVTAGFVIYLGRKIPQRLPGICITALLLAGLVAQLMLFYHVAVLLAAAGSIAAYRFAGPVILRRYGMYLLSSAAISLLQLTVLAARPGSIIKLVGAIVGQPSVWPYVRVAEFSVVAVTCAALATAWGLWCVASGKRAPDYVLLLVLGLWIPLFVIGFFVWNLPARYTAASLLPMLLAAFAFIQQLSDWLSQRLRSWSAARWAQTVAVLVVVVLIVNPPMIAAMLTNDSQHPDHKGAALFMRTQQLRPDDVILAEDVLEQTYYLGKVDYWLISRKVARRYVERVDGEIRDFYTGTRVIDSGAALEDLLNRYSDRRIFVIGSGENTSDGRRAMRGFGIAEVLTSDRFEVLYVGSDGFTKVWRAKPRAARGAASGVDSGGAGAAGVLLKPAARHYAVGVE
jgi:hypothetical protein